VRRHPVRHACSGEPFKNPCTLRGCGCSFCRNCVEATLHGVGIVLSQCPQCAKPVAHRELLDNRLLEGLVTNCGRFASAARCRHEDTATADVPAWRVGKDSFASAEHARPAAVPSTLLPAEPALEAAPSDQAVSTSLAILVEKSHIDSASMPDSDAAKHDTPQPSTQHQVYDAMAAELCNSQPSESPQTRGAMSAKTSALQPSEQRQADVATASTPGTSQPTWQCRSHKPTAGAAETAQGSEQCQEPEAQPCAADAIIACTGPRPHDQVRPASTSR
jgi:hypothetical protein